MLDNPNVKYGLPAAGAPYAVDFSQPPDTASRDLDPRRLWKIIWRRRKLLLAIWAGFFVLVALFTILTPKKYTTSVKLISGGSNANSPTATNEAGTNLPVLNALLAATGQQSSETYAELLQQSPVAEQVIKNLHLNMSVGDLLKHMLVRPVSDTAILALSVSWKDSVTSARIANEFASVFIDHERQLVGGQADSAVTFLLKEMPAAEEHMRAAQSALEAYQEQTGIADLTSQTQNVLTSVSTLQSKQQAAELDARQYAAQLEAIEEQLGSTPQTVVGQRTVSSNPVAGTLQSQVQTLRFQLDSARKQYTDDYPTVIQLKSQLAEAERELKSQPSSVLSGTEDVPNPVYQQLTQQAATLQGQIAASNSQAQTLAEQVAEAQPKVQQLPSESRRIVDLQRSAKAAEGVYLALQQKYQDAVISKTTALSDVSVTQPADPAVYTVTPNVPFNLLLGIIVGLALAISAIFAAEFFDDRFRSEDDIKERLGMPVLTMIPKIEALESKDDWMKPLAVEAFYQLVASLRYSSSRPPRTIAFTSAEQGDGKSTVALNAAISMGQMKSRVLIIDADLRRPSMHEKLQLSNEKGLSDVLVGISSFDDAVRPTEHSGVSVLTSGRRAPNPVALLQSNAFDVVLKRATERFDYVVVDCPALRPVVDSVVLGIKTDGTVLIVSSATSEGRVVRTAIEKLRAVGSINLLGVVLNRTRPD
ncbi:MAG: polysaccharide biosynthesis tyrosine autokinase, partial [Candidatus Eremiobacteraeota bacterium]|nr:polysaccharide biosynthesis tyrosine autokinase [Candidatus Eremiobacteraeota bacterium]